MISPNDSPNSIGLTVDNEIIDCTENRIGGSPQEELERMRINFNRTKPIGVMAGPANRNNLFVWNCLIDGPAGSPYEGGRYKMTVIFPSNWDILDIPDIPEIRTL